MVLKPGMTEDHRVAGDRSDLEDDLLKVLINEKSTLDCVPNLVIGGRTIEAEQNLWLILGNQSEAILLGKLNVHELG